MSAYSDRILADGAVAYWRLGEASGLVAADAGPNGLSGVIAVTGITYGVAGPLLGDSDTALTFAGSSDPITVLDNNALDLGDGPFTLECWIKRSATQSASQHLILKANTGGYRLSLAIANTVVGGRTGGAAFVHSTVSITDTTTWHHLAVVKDGSSRGLYIDGVDVSALDTDQTLVDTTGDLRIGSTLAVNRFPGSMDEVALYNVVLSPTQIAEHFALGRTLPLTDTATVSDSVSNEPQPNLADSVTASESTVKDVAQAQADTATVSDALTDEQDIVLGDSVTASDSQAADVETALADTVAASDATSTEPGSVQADSVTASDAQTLDAEVALDDSLTVSDALVAEGDLTLGDSVTATDSLTAEFVLELQLSDSVTVTDLETPVLTTGTLTPPEGGWRRIYPAQHYRLALADGVRASDELDTEHIEGIPTTQQKRELLALV